MKTRHLVISGALLSIFHSTNLLGQGINLTTAPYIQNISNNQTVSFHISVTPFGSFSQQVFFNIVSTNLPTGYSVTFSPNPLDYPYTGGDTMWVTVSNVSPVTDSCYLIFEAGNGPVQVYDTVYLMLTGQFCGWTAQSPTSFQYFNKLVIDNQQAKWMCSTYAGLGKFHNNLFSLYNETNSPLPSNTITDMDYSKLTNDLWLTTDSGLVRYDGLFWTVFNTANSSLPSNDLNSVALDSAGNVWVAAGAGPSGFLGGLIKFDGISVQLFDHLNSPLYIGGVALVRIDRQNNIWVVSHNSSFANLCKYNGTTWSEYAGNSSCFHLFRHVRDIAFDSNNSLWLAAGGAQGPVLNNSGMIHFDEISWEIWSRNDAIPYNHKKIDLSCNVIFQDNSSPFVSQDMAAIAVDDYDVKWLAVDADPVTTITSICRYDDITFSIYDNSNSVFNNFGRAGLDVDSSNHAWVTYTGHDMLYESDCIIFTTALIAPTIKSFTIFPNPAFAKTSIDISNVFQNDYMLSVYDCQGKLRERKIGDNNKTMLELDISGYAKGIYLIEITDSERSVVQKLIVE